MDEKKWLSIVSDMNMKYSIYYMLVLSLLVFSCGDPCDDIDCGPNGNCIDGSCLCDEGYSGVNCQINVCDGIDCNNGNCDTVTGMCDCLEGYEGTFCDTESRAKFIGSYSGDIGPCFESLIPLEQVPEEFRMVTALVTADPSSILNVQIVPALGLAGTSPITANPEAGLFIIPANSTTIELEELPFPVTVTVTGQGEFLDENSLNISLTIIIPLLQTINCTIEMKKN